MWKKFEIYSIMFLVLAIKGRALYAILYQEVFFGNPGRGVLKLYQTEHIFRTYIKGYFYIIRLLSILISRKNSE